MSNAPSGNFATNICQKVYNAGGTRAWQVTERAVALCAHGVRTVATIGSQTPVNNGQQGSARDGGIEDGVQVRGPMFRSFRYCTPPK